MPNMLESGMEWLASQLQEHAGRSVTYTRAAASVTLTATLGRKLLKVGDEFGGLRMVVTDRDYIITAADLILSGSLTLPAKGDTITDAGDPDGVSRTWEVLSPGGDEAPWNWSDPYRTLIRVHTKQVA